MLAGEQPEKSVDKLRRRLRTFAKRAILAIQLHWPAKAHIAQITHIRHLHQQLQLDTSGLRCGHNWPT